MVNDPRMLPRTQRQRSPGSRPGSLIVMPCPKAQARTSALCWRLAPVGAARRGCPLPTLRACPTKGASRARSRAAGAVALVDRGARQTDPVTSSCSSSVFAGFRFPREVISLAVRWYLRYGLSYRDVEELLAERGIMVDHVTIYRWVQRFTPEFIEAAQPGPAPARRPVVHR